MKCHFGRLEQDVDGHGSAAGLEDAEVGDHELGDVGQLQRHGVARPYPAGLQAGRYQVGQPV